MKRLSLVLLNLIVIGSFLAACTVATPVVEQVTTQEVEEEAPAAPESEEPVVLRVPINSDPEGTLEPGLVLALVTGWLSENLHAGLLKYDEDTNLTPYVAERYEISDDNLTYTFYLRENAKWHNGRPIVASDFKQGWERYLDPDIAAQAGADYLGSIVGAEDILDGKTEELAGVEVVDDHTLKVTTVEPDPAFLLRMATPFAWVVPPESVVEGQPEWVDQPVGGGPFKFVEWKTNEKVVLEAWDDFWLGRPSIDRIEYLIVPDPATAMAMYEAGELDVVAVTGADLQRVSQDPQLSQELQFWTRAQLVYYGLNMYKVDVFQDQRVRQAFNYALDKETIIDKLLFNAYQPGTGLVPPGIPEYNPDLEGYDYNPEKARELLAEAGYPDGAGFPTLQVTSDARFATESEGFAAQMKENLNIDIEVNIVERGEMVKGLWDHNTWDIFRWGWTADFPSAEVWTHQLLHSGLGSNFFGYENPDFDVLVDEARVTLDEQERIRLWQEAEEIAMEEAAMIPFAYNQYIYLVKPYVQGFNFNLNGPMWYKNVTLEK